MKKALVWKSFLKEQVWDRRSLKQKSKQGQDVSLIPTEKQVLVLWHRYLHHATVEFDSGYTLMYSL